MSLNLRNEIHKGRGFDDIEVLGKRQTRHDVFEKVIDMADTNPDDVPLRTFPNNNVEQNENPVEKKQVQSQERTEGNTNKCRQPSQGKFQTSGALYFGFFSPKHKGSLSKMILTSTQC